MLQASVAKALEEMAVQQWSDMYRLALEDRPFKPTDQDTRFIRHSIVFGDGEPTALGGGWYRYLGLQYLSIFYQSGNGNASLYEYADKIMTYYADRQIAATGTTVVFQVASSSKQPPDPKGFSQIQVVCPFYFDTRS